MEETKKTTHPKIMNTEQAYQILKQRILLYSNLYIPDFIVYDLAKTMEEFYEENSN